MAAMKVRVGWTDRRDDREDEYELTCLVTKGHSGSRDEPPDPGEVEVIEVADVDGNLRPDLIEVAQESLDAAEAFEAAEDRLEAEQEDYWDSLREARNEALCSTLRDIAGRR